MRVRQRGSRGSRITFKLGRFAAVAGKLLEDRVVRELVGDLWFAYVRRF